MQTLIEVIGWIGSILILTTYFLNINGKLTAGSSIYIWFNLIGGLFFVINTWYHNAYPSAILNIIWVLIALVALYKRKAKATGVVKND